MREIEFRGISATTGKFVYGDLIHALNGKVYINIKTISGGGAEFIQPIEVIANTVGEFIGLKDRENNKIWEGDLLEVSTPLDDGYVGNVVYDVYCWGIDYGPNINDFQMIIQSDHTCKIIGNIHEHKHLLEGK